MRQRSAPDKNRRLLQHEAPSRASPVVHTRQFRASRRSTAVLRRSGCPSSRLPRIPPRKTQSVFRWIFPSEHGCSPRRNSTFLRLRRTGLPPVFWASPPSRSRAEPKVQFLQHTSLTERRPRSVLCSRLVTFLHEQRVLAIQYMTCYICKNYRFNALNRTNSKEYTACSPARTVRQRCKNALRPSRRPSGIDTDTRFLPKTGNTLWRNRMLKQVLIVGDDGDGCSQLVEALSSAYELRLAKCGDEALSTLSGRNASRISAILLDLSRSAEDGISFLQTLSARPGLRKSGIDPFRPCRSCGRTRKYRLRHVDYGDHAF